MSGRVAGAVLAVGLAAAGVALWLVRRPAHPSAAVASGGILRLDWSIEAAAGTRYAVGVRIDGTDRLADTAAATAGALTVRRDLGLVPGTHSVSVSILRVGSRDSTVVPPAGRPPDSLQYAGLVTLAAGEVVEVTYQPARHRLMIHRPGAP